MAEFNSAIFIMINTTSILKKKEIILFDGHCILCNRLILFIIKKDPKSIFQFAALESETGKKIRAKYLSNTNSINSFVLIQNNIAFTKSTAALKVAYQLKGFSKILSVFIIIPPFLRDPIYNLIASNRIKWFGRQESCMTPTDNISSRFID